MKTKTKKQLKEELEILEIQRDILEVKADIRNLKSIKYIHRERSSRWRRKSDGDQVERNEESTPSSNEI